ncbi:MAG: ATP-binding protein [Rhizobiales bacterium]|nr:ATP-binding protein [Hyphomicrobiales bacterium]
MTQNNNQDFDHIPPRASATLESYRGVGYTPETAIADLIDNSIAARARNIWIEFIWRGAGSVVRVLDDGHGMDEANLTEAMRLASRHPLEAREPGDLGRFGLGLKTAALSQGRVLAVSSRTTTEQQAVRCWDLDRVAEVDEWQLLRRAPASIESDATVPAHLASGTAVVIGSLDRLLSSAGEDSVRAQFLAIARRVERHVGMTFHRFLEGPHPKVALFIGTDSFSKISPWDPFLQTHPATIATPVERLPHVAGAVEVQGFVLPHRDRLTTEQFNRAGGPEGWLAHQGFFMYRDQRLLVAGGWLGLGPGRRWARDDIHRLARVKLDLGSSGDNLWKVDIRKSIAVPPPALRPRLQALAEQVRRDAREVFAHRGGRSSRIAAPAPLRAWTAIQGATGPTYRIDRTHPVVRRVLDSAVAGGLLVEDMLHILERTLPVQRIWLETAERDDIAEAAPAPQMTATDQSVLLSIYAHLRIGLGLPAEQARQRLAAVEPFSSYPEAVAQLPDDPVT